MANRFEKTGTPGIYRRLHSDGKPRYLVAYRDQVSHRQAWSPSYDSLGNAKAFKREREELRRRSQNSPDKKLLLPAAWKRYVAQHGPELAPSTLDGYQAIYRCWFENRYKQTALVDIDVAEIHRLRAHLAKAKSSRTRRPLAPRRQRNILVCLQCFLSWAKTSNLVWTNAVADMGRGSKPKMAKRDAKRHVYLTHEEADDFLLGVELVRPDYVPLFFTALHTGARLGELLSLRVSDCDFVNDEITIQRSVYKGVEKDPKDIEPRRVGISKPLKAVLQDYLANGYINKVNNPKGLLFPGWHGDYIDPDNLRKRVFEPAKWAALPEAKAERFRIHDCRHTFASWLIQSGSSGGPSVDLPTIMELMGHSDYSTVLVYAHLDRSRAAAAGAAALSNP